MIIAQSLRISRCISIPRTVPYTTNTARMLRDLGVILAGTQKLPFLVELRSAYGVFRIRMQMHTLSRLSRMDLTYILSVGRSIRTGISVI